MSLIDLIVSTQLFFPGILRTAVSGGIGGVALWTAVYPVDVTKSRMQIAGTGTFGHILMGILKNEGLHHSLKSQMY